LTDHLAIIDRVMYEHQYVRQHIKLVGESVSDLEALFSLQQAHAGWAQSSVEKLSSKKLQMQQVLSQVDKGLKSHFAYEEENLPPLFGEILMKALLFEHQEIRKQMETASSLANETNLEGLNQRDVLSKKTDLQIAINSLCQELERHATLEEQILRMLKKTLETRAK
jgi:hypothetical protein